MGQRNFRFSRLKTARRYSAREADYNIFIAYPQYEDLDGTAANPYFPGYQVRIKTMPKTPILLSSRRNGSFRHNSGVWQALLNLCFVQSCVDST